MENKIIKLNDFEIICRICLNKKENMISIFETTSTTNSIKTFKDMLEECASVHISTDDLLPKNVCCECLKYLKQSYNFKIQYLSAEKLLEQIISNEKIITKVEQSDDESQEFKNEENSFDTYSHFTLNENDIDKNISQNKITIKEFFSVKDELINISNIKSDGVSKECSIFQKYTCNDCGLGFQIKADFYEHQKLVHLKDYKCISCSKIYKRLKDIVAHSPEDVICKLCKQDYGCKHNLRDHLDKDHKSCEVCGKIFENRRQCQLHLNNHNLRFLCTYCGKAFAHKTNYKAHIRSHTGEKPYQCTKCDAKFYHGTTLRMHLTTHSEERNYECDICKKKFKCNNAVIKHKGSHVEERNYNCDLCNKKFNTKKNLTNHRKIHTGERKHICSHCNKAFTKSWSLKLHLRSHTGEKPFICSICEKSFAQKHVLNSHMKTHSKMLD